MADYPIQGATPWDEALKAYIDDQDTLKADETDLAAHTGNTSNPHSTTKAQVGLSNADNTADASKPVSTAQAAAIAGVQSDVDAHEADTANPHSVTKSQVGLPNVDNTSDASKPVSTAQQAALDDKANTADLALVATTGSYNDLDDLPAGGGAKPKVQVILANGSSNPIAADGSATTNTGSGGAVSYGNAHGTLLSTSATNNSFAALYFNDGYVALNVAYGWWGAIYDRTFTVIMQVAVNLASDDSFFIGMGDAFAIPGSSNKHVGIKCVSTGGGGATQTWYATNGSGSAATVTDITAAVTSSPGYLPSYHYAVNNVVIEFSPTSIKYYFNGVLCATHTTNIPTGDNSGRPSTTLIAYIKQQESSSNSLLVVNRMLIEADAY